MLEKKFTGIHTCCQAKGGIELQVYFKKLKCKNYFSWRGVKFCINHPKSITAAAPITLSHKNEIMSRK